MRNYSGLADFSSIEIMQIRDRMQYLLNGKISEEVIQKLSLSVGNIFKIFASYFVLGKRKSAAIRAYGSRRCSGSYTRAR